MIFKNVEKVDEKVERLKIKDFIESSEERENVAFQWIRKDFTCQAIGNRDQDAN